MIRVQRGERVWLSVDETAGRDARISLTSAYVKPHGVIGQWIAKLSTWMAGPWAPRTR